MRYRARAQYGFARNAHGIHLARDHTVLQPVELVWDPLDPAIESPPAFYLDVDAMRALYDALGQALGLHLTDTKFAAEVLEREQYRVDKLIDHVCATARVTDDSSG